MTKQRIQVISMARAGSTYMGNAILFLNPKDTDGRSNMSEPFRYDETGKPELSLKKILRKLEKLQKYSFATAKHHACHYTIFKQQPYFELYNTVPWHSIGLIRTNLFELAMSRVLAETYNQWGDYNYLEKKYIPIEDFINHATIQMNELGRLQSLLPECHEVLRYEDLSGDYVTDLKKLKVYNGHILPTTVGIGIDRAPPKQDWVINYSELKSYGTNMLKNKQEEIDEWWMDTYASK